VFDEGNRSVSLQMEAEASDCRQRNVVVGYAVETEVGPFEERRSTGVAALELAFGAVSRQPRFLRRLSGCLGWRAGRVWVW
jgi:hypothetical protein